MAQKREYKNKLTLDGRLKLVNGVTERKVAAVRDLMEQHLMGNRIATGTLHEVLTTSDAVFNLAHLATLNFVPNFDEAPRTWRQIAGTRVVPDFRDVTLYGLNRSWNDGDGNESKVIGAHGEAPVIPEGTVYPYAYISGDTVAGARVQKRGLKTDWTLEARINDGLGVIEALPEALNEVALDTEESDVYTALTTKLPITSDLAGGLVPTGATVVPNAAFSRDAVIRAVIELGERKINGRAQKINPSFNLLVPVGKAVFVNFVLNQTLVSADKGSDPVYKYQINGYDPLAGVTVVETEWLTGEQWALVPKPGASRRPILERLELRGYQTPQLFVDNHVGNFLGSASVSPFEGSFDSDSITLKLRQFGGAVIWDSGKGIVWSTGLGVART